MLVSGIELILGIWLINGWMRRWSWWSSLCLFTFFSLANLYLIHTSQSSCGCFGRIMINPWYAFGVDVAVLFALLIWRPSDGPVMVDAGWPRQVVKAVTGSAVILAAVGGAFWLSAETPGDTLARIRGVAISIDPEIIDVGRGNQGDQRVVQAWMVNHTDRPVRIVGGTSTCSCVATDGLPATVPPHGRAAIAVKVKLKGTTGLFLQKYYFIVDDNQKQQSLVASVVGRIIE